jgi:hypothetical protein
MDKNIYVNDDNDNQVSETDIDERLLGAVIRLNTILTATVMGFLGGFGLFFTTLLSLNRGLPNTGNYLNLLGVFMPGYEVSPTGAWIGLIWGGVIGAICGGVLYRVYARNLRLHVRNFMLQDKSGDEPSTLIVPIGGKALGLALGAVVAGGLIVTTNWLVLRGTADESVHAQMLDNYLPGYSISFLGSLIGAIQLFLFVFFLCMLWSWIYNRIVSTRHRSAIE